MRGSRIALPFGFSTLKVLGTILLLTSTTNARADESAPFTVGPRPAWFLMAGPGVGASIVTHDRGWYVGGEASLVRMREGKFIGFLGDGYYDFGAKRTYT